MIKVQRLPTPVLWLDTSVVSHMVKVLEQGRTPNDPTLKPKLERLRDLILELGRAGKLICPQAEQREEYEKIDCALEIAQMYARLSWGVFMHRRHDVRKFEIQRGIMAFLERSNSVELPFDVYFERDTLWQMKNSRNHGLVPYYFKRSDAKVLDSQKKRDAELASGAEELQQKIRQRKYTFEQQLDIELRSLPEEFEKDLQQTIQKRLRIGMHTSGFPLISFLEK